MKKKSSTDIQTSPPKKQKLTKTTTDKDGEENAKDSDSKFSKSKKGSKNTKEPEKIEDWNKYKKEKKELRLKRIQARTKDNFDKIQQAKKMGEKLRLKTLKEDDRTKIINQLHSLLKGHYAKFVLAHDTARIVQWLLKYSSNIMVQQISQELIPVTVSMLQSKYGIHCVKRLLKYGEADIRTSVINQMQGHAVKLANHSLSSPVVEYAFSNWASSSQKQFLIQEFYGGLYKNSKDPKVKHLRDVYKENESMKAATLGACKTNIKKVLNKSLLDSGLVQSVLYQFLQECSNDDRSELITELSSHIVVISNSKDGSRAAMQCIWSGTNKDKKVIMKSLKEHLVDLCKHEFGHNTIIALLDTVDDTVLLHKLILFEILKNAKDLAVNEWGRKVLLWLVAPANPAVFHPKFIKELAEGREQSNAKKSLDIRRKEILNYSISTLLNLILEDTQFWLSTGSLAIEMLAILKAGSGNILEKTLRSVTKVICDVNWIIKEGESDISGIEHAGLHMTLKKLAQHDKVASQNDNPTFGKILVDSLTDDVIKHWLKINRGCFLLVAVFENSEAHVQNMMKDKLKPHMKLLKSQTTSGAGILAKKL
ncbi:hypothetical protein GWI33_016355 [Rhynchophorus ferrugineus]|uniref:PUM-HD domain-containing protein n=1 Tax=Rhynchophorus ferrugineus TaxID=354439 RepID=A0A834M3E4_RHYFE|nr:hypothetical protein GWI33_016355 [Rhynchophorus ferrugineus]